MSRLVDYFAVVGYDYQRGNANLLPGDRVDAQLVQRFPLDDWSECEFPNGVEMFCQPVGWTVCRTAQPPTFHQAVFTYQNGSRAFASFLTFYEPPPIPPRAEPDEYRDDMVSLTGVSVVSDEVAGSSSLPQWEWRRPTGPTGSLHSQQPDSADSAAEQETDTELSPKNSLADGATCNGQTSRAGGDFCDGVDIVPAERPRRFYPKCLVFLSRLDFKEVFRVRAISVADRLKMNCLNLIYTAYVERKANISLEHMVSVALSIIVPPPGGSVVRFSLGADDRQAVQPPQCSSIPASANAVYLLLKQVGISHTIMLVCAALTEHKLLLHSASLNCLNEACRALSALLYPFQYSLIYIPMLPSLLIDSLQAPTPFLIGIHSSTLRLARDHDVNMHDVIIVDLDGGSVQVPECVQIPSLPETVFARALNSLNLILNPGLLTADLAFPTSLSKGSPSEILSTIDDPPEYLDKQIRAVFLRTFAELLYGYRSCLVVVRIHPEPYVTFDKAKFLSCRNFVEDPLMTKLVETIAFDTFIDQRGNPYRVCDIFDKAVSTIYEQLQEESPYDSEGLLVSGQYLAAAADQFALAGGSGSVSATSEGCPLLGHMAFSGAGLGVSEKVMQNIKDIGMDIYNNENPHVPFQTHVSPPSTEARSLGTLHSFPMLDSDTVQQQLRELLDRPSRATPTRPTPSRATPTRTGSSLTARPALPDQRSDSLDSLYAASSATRPVHKVVPLGVRLTNDVHQIASNLPGTQRVQVLRTLMSLIFEHKDSEARKIVTAVLKSLKNFKTARQLFASELINYGRDQGNKDLDQKQFDLIVRLSNQALQHENMLDESGVAAAIFDCGESFNRRLPSQFYHCLYYGVQDHEIWLSISFWVQLFYRQVEAEVKRMYEPQYEHLRQQSSLGRGSLSGPSSGGPSSVVDGKTRPPSRLANPIHSSTHRPSLSSIHAAPYSGTGTSPLRELTCLEIAAEELRKWPSMNKAQREKVTTEEEQAVVALATHYVHKITKLLVPLDPIKRKQLQLTTQAWASQYNSRNRTLTGVHSKADESTSSQMANSVAESDSMSSDAESGYHDDCPIERNVYSFLEDFLERVLKGASVDADHIERLKANIPQVVLTQLDTLEATNEAASLLPTMEKARILRPKLAQHEVLIGRELRAFLLIDGRDDLLPGSAGNWSSMAAQQPMKYAHMQHQQQHRQQRPHGPSTGLLSAMERRANAAASGAGGVNGTDWLASCLLPAEGALFLTNYRLIFKGTPCDPLASEQLIIRSFPVSTLVKEKSFKEPMYLPHLDQVVSQVMHFRSNSFQFMKVAFDMDDLVEAELNTFRLNLLQLSHPQSIFQTYAFVSCGLDLDAMIQATAGSSTPADAALARGLVRGSTSNSVTLATGGGSGSVGSVEAKKKSMTITRAARKYISRTTRGLRGKSAGPSSTKKGGSVFGSHVKFLPAAAPSINRSSPASTVQAAISNTTGFGVSSLTKATNCLEPLPPASNLDLYALGSMAGTHLFPDTGACLPSATGSLLDSQRNSFNSLAAAANDVLFPNSRRLPKTIYDLPYVHDYRRLLRGMDSVGSGHLNELASGTDSGVSHLDISSTASTMERGSLASRAHGARLRPPDPTREVSNSSLAGAGPLQSDGTTSVTGSGFSSAVGNYTDDVEICSANENYVICKSYPALLMLPKRMAKADSLQRLAKGYKQGRFPILSWRHPRTRACIFRAASFNPKGLMGLFKGDKKVASVESSGSREILFEQEQYFTAVVHMTPLSKMVRSRSNSVSSLSSCVSSVSSVMPSAHPAFGHSYRADMGFGGTLGRSGKGMFKSPGASSAKHDQMGALSNGSTTAAGPATAVAASSALVPLTPNSSRRRRQFQSNAFSRAVEHMRSGGKTVKTLAYPSAGGPATGVGGGSGGASQSYFTLNPRKGAGGSGAATGDRVLSSAAAGRFSGAVLGSVAADASPDACGGPGSASGSAGGRPAAVYVLAEKGQFKQMKSTLVHKIPLVEWLSIDVLESRDLRETFKKLRRVCCPSAKQPPDKGFAKLFEDTRWLEQVQRLLEYARAVANLVDQQGSSVMLCLEDGWDFTAQVVSLSLLLLDPYYRTFSGFQTLIEREWLAYGHRFSYRSVQTAQMKHASAGFAPFFLQFLDCVHQIQHQFPVAFEFNAFYIRFLAYHHLSNRFPSFMFDCEQERLAETLLLVPHDTSMGALPSLCANSESIWSYVDRVNASRGIFFNPLYIDQSSLLRGVAGLQWEPVLYPQTSASNLCMWEYFTEDRLAQGSSYDLDLAWRELCSAAEESGADLMFSSALTGAATLDRKRSRSPLERSYRRAISPNLHDPSLVSRDAFSDLFARISILQAELNSAKSRRLPGMNTGSGGATVSSSDLAGAISNLDGSPVPLWRNAWLEAEAALFKDMHAQSADGVGSAAAIIGGGALLVPAASSAQRNDLPYNHPLALLNCSQALSGDSPLRLLTHSQAAVHPAASGTGSSSAMGNGQHNQQLRTTIELLTRTKHSSALDSDHTGVIGNLFATSHIGSRSPTDEIVSSSSPHHFEPYIFSAPTICDYCQKVLFSNSQTLLESDTSGVMCVCDYKCHSRCAENVRTGCPFGGRRTLTNQPAASASASNAATPLDVRSSTSTVVAQVRQSSLMARSPSFDMDPPGAASSVNGHHQLVMSPSGGGGYVSVESVGSDGARGPIMGRQPSSESSHDGDLSPGADVDGFGAGADQTSASSLYAAGQDSSKASTFFTVEGKPVVRWPRPPSGQTALRTEPLSTTVGRKKSAVVHSGELWKQGHNLLKGWKRRYFVLDAAQHEIIYYDSKPEGDALERPRGAICLADAQLVRQANLRGILMQGVPKWANDECCFELKTATRTWHFLARTPQLVQEWIEKIEERI